jgi:hypothetical protein
MPCDGGHDSTSQATIAAQRDVGPEAVVGANREFAFASFLSRQWRAHHGAQLVGQPIVASSCDMFRVAPWQQRAAASALPGERHAPSR